MGLGAPLGAPCPAARPPLLPQECQSLTRSLYKMFSLLSGQPTLSALGSVVMSGTCCFVVTEWLVRRANTYALSADVPH